MKTKPVPVTARALLARINRKQRKQRKDYLAVRRCRPESRAHSDLGTFYELDTYRNVITGRHLDLESYARDLGVMRSCEALA
jgi:hypothetical protein